MDMSIVVEGVTKEKDIERRKEHWKMIEGHPYYMISDKGRAVCVHKPKGAHFEEGFMTPRVTETGYLYISVGKIHRLVAEAFIPNPNHYPFINHKDEIKAHNWKENLEWCTAEYNDNYGNRNKKIKEKLNQPDIKKKRSESMSKAYQNEELKKKLSNSMKKMLAKPENKRKRSEIMLKRWEEHPEAHKKISETMLKHWDMSPEERKIRNRKNNKKVYQVKMDKNKTLLKCWPSHGSIPTKNGFFRNVLKCLQHKQESYCGYYWLNDDEYRKLRKEVK